MKVSHEPTGKMGEVHSILPNSSFELGFSEQPMLGRKAIITWTSHDGRKNKAELTLPRDQSRVTKDRSINLVYTIHRNGYVTVEIKEPDL